MGAVKTAEKASGGTATATPKESARGTHHKGLKIHRRWTRATIHPFDEINWELRTASIGNEKGEVVLVGVMFGYAVCTSSVASS